MVSELICRACRQGDCIVCHIHVGDEGEQRCACTDCADWTDGQRRRLRQLADDDHSRWSR